MLAIIALAGVVVWATLPQPQIFDLGPIDSFRTDGPTRHLITLRDGKTIPLWSVRDGETWIVFDGYAGPCRYQYRWVPTNHRFEDPCSGYKWAINGILLTYLPNPGKAARDLDRYAAFVKDGHLMVNLGKRQPGTARPTQPPEVICGYSLFSCQLRAPTPAP
ncbi:MAG: putative Quinol-cytochrome c reductase, iron-sulfur subunit (Rieske iron-sulfur protein) [Anaerolineales bacterium]|nr:putative Quinol-cytochrome c reductase, iron-sulfur subunit (Rieske iron-sulfur protein) [Anaerolineales bacterium]